MDGWEWCQGFNYTKSNVDFYTYSCYTASFGSSLVGMLDDDDSVAFDFGKEA